MMQFHTLFYPENMIHSGPLDSPDSSSISLPGLQYGHSPQGLPVNGLNGMAVTNQSKVI